MTYFFFNPSLGLAALTEISRSDDVTLEIFHGYEQTAFQCGIHILKTSVNTSTTNQSLLRSALFDFTVLRYM
jgi:hypothetical protein